MSDTTANRSHRAARRRAEREDRKQDSPRGVKLGRSGRDQAIEWIKAIAWALGVALLIRQFLFQAFRIPSASMQDTLLIHDFLFVNKLTYGPKTPDRMVIPFWNKTLIEGIPHTRLPGFRDPRQGDIIVFEYPDNRNQDYIKRCVAVAGDEVQVTDGILRVNGEVYESNFADYGGDHACVPDWRNSQGCPEPHSLRVQGRQGDGSLTRTFGPLIVPEGHLFMMGDNRFNSLDSRFWGTLPVELVKGRAEIIYWSYEKLFFFPRFDRLLKLIDLPPSRAWMQPAVRIGVLLAIIGTVLYYRRRDFKKATSQEE